MKTIEEVVEYLKKNAEVPIDNAEYWEWGNYDDSYRLGLYNGEIYAFRQALEFVTNEKRNYTKKDE